MAPKHSHRAIRIGKLAIAPDHLTALPKPNHQYLSVAGKPLWDRRYTPPSQRHMKKSSRSLKSKGSKARSQRESCIACRKNAVDPCLLASETERPARGLDSSRTYFLLPPIEQRHLNPFSNHHDPLQEDAFHSKPMINLPVPDHVQAMLVDDWENVTKNNQLVPLPHPTPVSKIFQDYLDYEVPRREEASASMDILEEVIAGFREYFEKALSRILLYRFERHQYMEVRKLWDNVDDKSEYKSVCDVYGAEHLARLIVSLPELLAQTNMDQQSINRLREEISKFTVWLSRNTEKYFVSEYETPSQEYVDKARSF